MSVDVLQSASTSAISDALDMAGVAGQVWGPRRMSGVGMRVGPAWTVRFAPVDEGRTAPAADYIDDVPSGAMIVIATGARPHTVWGDILTEVAVRRGVAGTVIDGSCRDLDAIREFGYPLWARQNFMRTGKNRLALAAVQLPVDIGADEGRVRVSPGDTVCADGDGVVVIPQARLTQTCDLVGRVMTVEKQILGHVEAGMPLRRARAELGYHGLAPPVPNARVESHRQRDDSAPTASE